MQVFALVFIVGGVALGTISAFVIVLIEAGRERRQQEAERVNKQINQWASDEIL